VATADFGYLRLRRLDYDPAGIADWGTRIVAQSWSSVYAYLKHEVLGPLFAEALLASMTGKPMADLSEIRASLAAPKPKSTRSPASKPKKQGPGSSKVPAARVSKVPAPPASKAPASPGSKAKASRPAKAPGDPRKA
jgi:hypothetical protein